MWTWLVKFLTSKVSGWIAVILIVTILGVGDFYLGFNKGYAKCVKDRPTIGTQNIGTQINQTQSEHKWLGVDFNLWKLKLSLGL